MIEDQMNRKQAMQMAFKTIQINMLQAYEKKIAHLQPMLKTQMATTYAEAIKDCFGVFSHILENPIESDTNETDPTPA